MEGSGNVKDLGMFEATEASVAIAGSGNVTMFYKGGSIDTSAEGSGEMNAGVNCDRLKVSATGSGDVRATDPLSRSWSCIMLEVGT